MNVEVDAWTRLSGDIGERVKSLQKSLCMARAIGDITWSLAKLRAKLDPTRPILRQIDAAVASQTNQCAMPYRAGRNKRGLYSL